MNTSKITTLKRELAELDRRCREIDAQMKASDIKRADAQRRVSMLEHYQANNQRKDDAKGELENIKRYYDDLNRRLWDITNEARTKNRELSALTQSNVIDSVARGFRR